MNPHSGEHVGIQIRDDLSTTEFIEDTINHWVTKNDITRGIVEGIPAKALCGIIFIPSSHDGDTANGTSLVCPLCQLEFESLAP